LTEKLRLCVCSFLFMVAASADITTAQVRIPSRSETCNSVTDFTVSTWVLYVNRQSEVIQYDFISNFYSNRPNTNIMLVGIIYRPVYFSKDVSEAGFCLRLQIKSTQLGPVDRASLYLRTSIPAPRWGIQAKHSTNYMRELRKHLFIKTIHVWGLAPENYQYRNRRWRDEILRTVPAQEK
jgi:hypothetical protein